MNHSKGNSYYNLFKLSNTEERQMFYLNLACFYGNIKAIEYLKLDIELNNFSAERIRLFELCMLWYSANCHNLYNDDKEEYTIENCWKNIWFAKGNNQEIVDKLLLDYKDLY